MKLAKTLALVTLAGATSATLAAPVSLGFGPGISYTSTHSSVGGLNLFEIGGPADGFSFDPAAGGWEKILLPPSSGFQPGQIYTVREWFTFFPSPTGLPDNPLQDWHEIISFAPDGQIWDVWTDVNGPPVISFDPDSREPIPGLQYMISIDGTSLWFDFDSIFIGPNGVTLHIEKEFRYTGNSVSFNPVTIYQYPTPAPGSLAILALAGLCTTSRRR